MIKFTTKPKIHNRFEIKVLRDGGVIQEGIAENILLDGIYTRLCPFNSYFAYIHFGTGTGTGTPSPERNALFSSLGNRIAIDEERIYAFPVSSWTRKIVLNPEEYVGQIFTEVGISESTSSTALRTHAMIKDSEGNPLSLEKTALDVIEIYATIFVELAGDARWVLGSNNSLLRYLLGETWTDFTTGITLAGALAGSGNPRILSKGVSITSLTASRQSRLTTRFGIAEGNDEIYAAGWSTTNNLSRGIALFSIPDLISSGMPAPSFQNINLGTGDGEKRKFRLPTSQYDMNSLEIKVDGLAVIPVKKSFMPKAHIMLGGDPWTGSFTGPPNRHSQFGSIGTGVAVASNGRIVCMGHDGSSNYPIVYKFHKNEKDILNLTRLGSNASSYGLFAMNSNTSFPALSANEKFFALHSPDGVRIFDLDKIESKEEGYVTHHLSSATNAISSVILEDKIIIARTSTPTLMCYAFDQETGIVGNLLSSGSPRTTGISSPHRIQLTPNKKFILFAENTRLNVVGFDDLTGVIGEIISTFSTPGGNIRYLDCSPSGDLVSIKYSVSPGLGILEFNQSTGVLGAPFTIPATFQLAEQNQGSFVSDDVFVCKAGTNRLASGEINRSSKELILMNADFVNSDGLWHGGLGNVNPLWFDFKYSEDIGEIFGYVGGSSSRSGAPPFPAYPGIVYGGWNPYSFELENAPALDSVVRGSYTTSTHIPKDANYVFDVTIDIQWGEGI